MRAYSPKMAMCRIALLMMMAASAHGYTALSAYSPLMERCGRSKCANANGALISMRLRGVEVEDNCDGEIRSESQAVSRRSVLLVASAAIALPIVSPPLASAADVSKVL